MAENDEKNDETVATVVSDTGAESPVETTPADEPAGLPNVTDIDPVTGPAKGLMASDGTVIEVPKTPEAIAEQGTRLGLANDFATGGVSGDPAVHPKQPKFTRVWGMDADHTENNRGNLFSVKPDCSTHE